MTIDDILTKELYNDLKENYGANKKRVLTAAQKILDKYPQAAQDPEKFTNILTDLVSSIPAIYEETERNFRDHMFGVDSLPEMIRQREQLISQRLNQVFLEFYPENEQDFEILEDDYSSESFGL